MDNLTHSLTGLMLSRAGLNRAVPRATVILVLAANIPDVDAISLLWGPDAYIQHHRGFTHALAAIPVMALLPVLAAWVWNRGRPLPWLRAWLVSIAGTATHPLLDYTNAYGIRLLLPVSSEWLALSLTSVVDLWIWCVLISAVVFPALSRLVSSEIGARPTPGRGWAVFALIFVLVYNSGRAVLHHRAVAVQEARLYESHVPKRVLAYPHTANPLLWDGIVETEPAWVLHQVRLWEEFDPGQGQVIYKTPASPALDSARRTPLFQFFFTWSRAPHFQVLPAQGSERLTEVRAVDLWFRFAAEAIVGPDARVRSTSFEFR
jgi:inner membrane protein